MLKELYLKNFKGFEEHVVPLRHRTIIVGKNNAGKSTIIEALRLIALVANDYLSLPFHSVPRWLDIPKREKGLLPHIKDTEVNLESMFHRYNDPPAIIRGIFDTEESISIYIGQNGVVHAVVKDEKGKPLTSEEDFEEFYIPDIRILPRIGPLSRKERILTRYHIERSLDTTLSPLHFRNQLNLYYDRHFERFKELAESTWSGLRIVDLEGKGEMPGDAELSLLVQDAGFVAEVGWMGHGLQIWLQLIWFLTRSSDPEMDPDEDTFIFDEPDVFMHADLQRKFIRVLRKFKQQVIIATHSTEMLAEVEPEQILIVDREKRRSNFATTLPSVQVVLNRIGSAHNIQLARLWSARRFLLVEGDDLNILKLFQNILFPYSLLPLDVIPHNSIGGWGGWNNVIGSTLVLKNAAGEDITTYCILDSDYHTPEQVQSRLDEANRYLIQLHIWSRKEIENYLIIPTAIQRLIRSESNNRHAPELETILGEIDRIADDLRDSIFDAMAHDYITDDRARGVSGANERARERLRAAWADFDSRLAVIPGKRVLSLLSQWTQINYGISFGVSRLARSITADELSTEVVEVVTAIENQEEFARQRI
jgi:energy-coupling factor transporter ATP-binding protein EcfA2